MSCGYGGAKCVKNQIFLFKAVFNSQRGLDFLFKQMKQIQ